MHFTQKSLIKTLEIVKRVIILMIFASLIALARAATAQAEGEMNARPAASRPTHAADHSLPAVSRDTTNASADLSTFASVQSGRLSLGALGQVVGVDGSGTVLRSKGSSEKLAHDTLLFEGDKVRLTHNARAVIRLSDGQGEKNQSLVTLFGDSDLVVDEAKADGAENLRETQLILETGEMRALVPASSDPVLPTFHVKLPTSQVNLKSGDAWIRVSPTGSDGQMHSRLTMREGKGTLLTERAVDGKPDYVDVSESQFAEFIQAVIPPGATVGVAQRAIDHGQFTEPAGIEDTEIAKMNARVDVIKDVKRKAALAAHAQANKKSADVRTKKLAAVKKARASQAKIEASHLCHAPGGQFNECAWTCAGKNPKAAKSCRTDLDGVACMRTICRANGEWKEETRLPASQSDFCPAQGSVVHECGVYW